MGRRGQCCVAGFGDMPGPATRLPCQCTPAAFPVAYEFHAVCLSCLSKGDSVICFFCGNFVAMDNRIKNHA